MKRIISLILSMIIVFCFVGCGNREKQDALLEYINNDIVSLTELEDAVLESYGSVTGDNYSSDEESYNEFTTNTINYARQLYDETVVIAGKIKDNELLEVHKIYMNYSSALLDAMTLSASSIENQDIELATSANEKINEANNLAIEFKARMYDLAEKRGVKID